jgi:hypothetical protein
MDSNLIKIRLHEVATEMDRLKGRLALLAAERDELEIAERVINRLSGGKRVDAGSETESQPSPSARTEEGKQMTIRQMVMESLMDARQRGLPGLAPKHIREYIQSHFGRDIGQQANTTASRMWREIGEIAKDEETGLFSLPSKETSKSADIDDLLGT